MSARNLIGVFDSGLGGLSVVKELMPHYSLIYFGDTARFPYGTKSAETVLRYARENAAFLCQHGIGALVVACNTATAVSLPSLQRELSIPVVGVIAPAAQQAVHTTKNGRIGVIGTTRTILSRSYELTIGALAPGITVYSQACPLLVSLIEEGSPSPDIDRAVIRAYLAPLIEAGVDTLLLGCTHYPLLRPLIQEEVGPEVSIIDPAQSCARALQDIMPPSIGSQCRFFASDDAGRFTDIAQAFLHMQVSVEIV